MRRTAPMLLVPAIILAACASSKSVGTSITTAPPGTRTGLLSIHHVFLVVLENEDYAATFQNPADYPYLANTLTAKGVLLTNYYAVGHASAGNYIGLVSGQPPNPSTQADCLTFADFPPGAAQVNGIQQGTGCAYPSQVPTLADQLQARGDTWRAYMEDMGNDPAREAPACAHPAIGAADPTELAVPGDGYVTRHDPFAYFHSVIDDPASCASHIVPLGSAPAAAVPLPAGLAKDLTSTSTIPNFSLIVPNVCHDGHDYPCTNQPSGPSVGADVDGFLQRWVPLIMASPAYADGGMIEITFDEASASNASACCAEQPGPAAALPGVTGPGGGKVGAIVISRYATAGAQSSTEYNHYSSLATFETIFDLPRLGEARSAAPFGSDVLPPLPS